MKHLDNKRKIFEKIKQFRSERKQNQFRSRNLITVKRCDKLIQALNLPKVLNLNPRSIYNKIEEFVTFVQEEEIDLTCISESWEREGQTLDQVIKLDNHKIISNVFQRKEVGGRPAIIASTEKYHVENLTQSVVSIPWGVEAVWAVLTPKNVTSVSKIQKIVVGSIYSKPDSRKKSVLLDHIAEVYNQLCSKFGKGLHWIICGDTNDLKLDPILHLNKNFKQVVQDFTRLNPPRILDPIITTLSDYYQLPKCLPPLDADPLSNGKPSDHMMVVMEPLSVINNKPARTKRDIIYRPFTDVRLHQMQQWILQEDWSVVTHENSAHRKTEILQNMLLSKYYEYFPEKKRTILSDDQPYFTEKLNMMKRRKGREYNKHRRSNKWKSLNASYVKELSKAKKSYFRKKIKNLKNVNPRLWHRELKKLTSFDQHSSDELKVESIKDLPVKEQVELIADKFAEVSQEYEKLETEHINFPIFEEKDIPQVPEAEVIEALANMDTSKSNTKDDIPAKILKTFALQLGKPVTDIINSSIRQGCWPNIFKLEVVTPVPKVFPPKSIEDLRNISGLLNLDKIAEKIIAKMMINDMKESIDPSQFANQKGLSIQHYLVKFIDRVLESVDRGSKNEACAVLATLVDWKQAFPRQCPKLGVESFIKNGVRPALIPLLTNYFQGRKMIVKWKGEHSSERELKGGGPQGSTFGIWEYLSQSNSNADCISESDRFKFVDDLTFLEIIFLLSVGLASYNVRQHVSSNLPTHNQIIPAKNLKTQQHLDDINKWTEKQKMKLNVKKTKSIIFNFSKKYKFSTQLSVNNENIEIVNEAKLLGTYLTEDLKWNKNTSEIVKKSYRRMQLLNRAAKYTSNKNDLRSIYLTYVRSILEQSAVVWHSSLSAKNRRDLERVQKCAVRVILGNNYSTYKNGLQELNIENLNKRRESICLKFAKKCLTNEKVKDIFQKNDSKHKMMKRKRRKFRTKKIKTDRYKKSAVPYMTDLLNKDAAERQMIICES